MSVRVLLVEDEEWIRKGLVKSILWDELGLTLAGETANGLEALSFLTQERVDVVITDMRMPACDGRQLLIEIEKRQMHCEIVVLSEYSDFAYMQQAIHAKVFDYLLKPVDTVTLNECLRSIVEKHALNGSRSKRPADSPLSWLLFTLGCDLPSPGMSVCARDQYCAFFASHDVFIACFQAPDMRIREACATIERITDECVKHGDLYDLVTVPDSDGLSVLLYSASSAGLDGGRTFVELLDRMRDAALQSGCALRIGALRTPLDCDHPLDALSRTVQATQIVHHGKSELVFAEQLSASESIPLNFTIGEKQLQAFFERPCSASADHLIQQLMHWARSVEYLPVATLQKLLIDLSLSLEKNCQKAGFSVNISRKLGQNYIDAVRAVQSLPAMEQYLGKLFASVLHAAEHKRTLTAPQVVGEIVTHLQTHYAESISLMEFSERYHLNYIYLSRLFKERTGATFTEYLQSIRMRHAKHLMEQGDLSTKEIAELCGYPNPYYFTTAYKKFYGKE